MLSGEATNTNFIVFGLTRLGLEPTQCTSLGVSMLTIKIILTDLLHIHDLILKLFVWYFLFDTSYFPYDGQNVTMSWRTNENDNELEYNVSPNL